MEHDEFEMPLGYPVDIARNNGLHETALERGGLDMTDIGITEFICSPWE